MYKHYGNSYVVYKETAVEAIEKITKSIEKL